jgi:hypothetical protein
MGRTEAIVADVEAAVRPLRDRQRGCQTHTRQGCRDLRTRQLPQDAVDRRPRLPPSHSMRWAPERSLGHRRRGSGTTPATATVSGRTIRGQSGTAAARRTLDGSAAADSQIGRRHFGAVDPPPPTRRSACSVALRRTWPAPDEPRSRGGRHGTRDTNRQCRNGAAESVRPGELRVTRSEHDQRPHGPARHVLWGQRPYPKRIPPMKPMVWAISSSVTTKHSLAKGLGTAHTTSPWVTSMPIHPKGAFRGPRSQRKVRPLEPKPSTRELRDLRHGRRWFDADPAH